MREINQDGINIIKKWETLSLVSYYCPAGVLTIGYGHTGPDVKAGMLITEKRAEELLVKDCDIACRSVAKLIRKDLNNNQFSALVSFFFNIGETKLKDSTIVKKLNDGDYNGASKEFIRWNKSNKKVLNGLTNRRKEEAALFLKPSKENLC